MRLALARRYVDGLYLSIARSLRLNAHCDCGKQRYAININARLSRRAPDTVRVTMTNAAYIRLSINDNSSLVPFRAVKLNMAIIALLSHRSLRRAHATSRQGRTTMATYGEHSRCRDNTPRAYHHARSPCLQSTHTAPTTTYAFISGRRTIRCTPLWNDAGGITVAATPIVSHGVVWRQCRHRAVLAWLHCT